mgnify:CR=1 FL=1
MQAVTPTTRAAIRAEVTHIVRHPGDLLLSVASSAAIVLFLWYVVPRSWFFTFTGPEGLGKRRAHDHLGAAVARAYDTGSGTC